MVLVIIQNRVLKMSDYYVQIAHFFLHLLKFHFFCSAVFICICFVFPKNEKMNSFVNLIFIYSIFTFNFKLSLAIAYCCSLAAVRMNPSLQQTHGEVY